MVVNDFNLMGIAIEPDETDAPLIVDADTVLPFAIRFEPMKPVPRWRLQIRQTLRRMQHQ